MNIGIIAPIPEDGTSLYRAYGPFSYISRETGAHLVTCADWGWPEIMGVDCVFMQRPFMGAHVTVARHCKVLNVPLWVDYDDLYSGFPKWLQVQEQMYSSPHALECANACVELADVVTVSTDALRCISPKARVIPNALNSYIWPMTHRKRNKIVSWRGSGCHNGDLDSVMEEMQALAAQCKEWEWHFFGAPHFKCCSFGKIHPYTDAFSFMEDFCATAPAINVVPLVDCEFNRCKSNNAWLEATAAGALTIAPDWPEWQRPGVLNYSDTKSFKYVVNEAMSMDGSVMEAKVQESRDYIRENLTLGNVNQKRIEILKGFQVKR